jgi:phage shock protein E
MIRKIILAVLLVTGTLCTGAFAAQKDDAAAVIIDVRTEAEWKEGHLEGAVLIPYDRIEFGIKTVANNKQSRVYLYCRSGRRTGIAFDVLKKDGYTDVINLGTVENAAKVLQRAVVR